MAGWLAEICGVLRARLKRLNMRGQSALPKVAEIVAVRLTESAYDDPGSTGGSASSDRVKLRHVLVAARPAVWLSLASKMAARRSVGRIGPAS